MDIEANLAEFTGDRMPGARYTSFDYCFNYFQYFREQNRVADIAARENMQLSCLHLVSDTLATKVVLRVFGNVPAFDTSFGHGSARRHSAQRHFSRLGEFYREHADIIERNRICTLDFQTGELTQRRYSRAKVIDMIFFIVR